MTDYILYAERFVCVAEPYIWDEFVKAHHRSIRPEEVDLLIPIYTREVLKNKLLEGLVTDLKASNGSNKLHIVDIGVYMGVFSIAMAAVSKQAELAASIHAYEANPVLVPAIGKNLQLHGVRASLHFNAIGRSRGKQDFVVGHGVAIGGSLVNSGTKNREDFSSYTVDVLPLSDVISDDDDLALVKIDIEGYEVLAFSSICRNKEKLNNIFIVEYAHWQGSEEVEPGVPYNEFLVHNFSIFNVGNWAWSTGVVCIEGVQSLNDCTLGNGGHNTDLLLITKGAKFIPTRYFA